MSVARDQRRAFFTAVPGFIAVWALSAFYLALGPKLAATLTGNGNVALDTVIVALLTGAGSIASIPFRAVVPARVAVVGLVALLAGSLTTLAALLTSSTTALFLGSGIAGIGWGLAYLGLFKLLIALAPSGQRAGMVASIYDGRLPCGQHPLSRRRHHNHGLRPAPDSSRLHSHRCATDSHRHRDCSKIGDRCGSQ